MRWERGLTLPQRYSWYILQSQPTAYKALSKTAIKTIISINENSFYSYDIQIHPYFLRFPIVVKLKYCSYLINLTVACGKKNIGLPEIIKFIDNYILFFQAAVMLILLYWCTSWTLRKRPEKRRNGNSERMQRALLNKSWKQQSTKQLLYSHLHPISKVIQVRHVGHCWRSKGALRSNGFPWTPAHGRASVGQPARTNLHQLCALTGCSLENLPGAIDDRDE